MRPSHPLGWVAALLLSTAATPQPADLGGHGGTRMMEEAAASARRLPGLGTLHRPVTTRSPEAQAFFDQGLRLYYAFNHDEAFRAFAKAAQLDPTCAMCFWGASLSLGPNYNMPMLPDRAATAWRAREEALAAARVQASEVERALVDALAARYAGPELSPPEAQQRSNQAYANAMREVARRFPDDADVQALFAEALMDLNPWKLWQPDGTPALGTPEIVATLERALARHPDHPGVNHLYIHAVEASRRPERALGAAERLEGAMPGAGHLVHMPAHIYQRVGRYADATEANRRAIEADKQYARSATLYGHYLGMYAPHNYTFLAYSAATEGRAQDALRHADEGVRDVPAELLEAAPMVQFYLAMPVVLRARFGRWDEVLSTPRPDARYPTATGLWLFSRGLARVAVGRVDIAERKLAELEQLRATLPEDAMAGNSSGRVLLSVAASALQGVIAERKGDEEGAVRALREAVRHEDALGYDEPPNWWLPTRHLLGEVLLAHGEAAEAERVWREDLQRAPGNGWALKGLERALRAEGRTREADQVATQFKAAWRRADSRPSLALR